MEGKPPRALLSHTRKYVRRDAPMARPMIYDMPPSLAGEMVRREGV